MMGQQQTVAQKEAGGPLRRMVVALTMAAVVVAVMALSAGPAQAKLDGHPDHLTGTDKTIFSGGVGKEELDDEPGGSGIGAIFDNGDQTGRTSGGGGGQDEADRGGGTSLLDEDGIVVQHGSNPPELPN
jgi:hypothetical protein